MKNTSIINDRIHSWGINATLEIIWHETHSKSIAILLKRGGTGAITGCSKYKIIKIKKVYFRFLGQKPKCVSETVTDKVNNFTLIYLCNVGSNIHCFNAIAIHFLLFLCRTPCTFSSPFPKPLHYFLALHHPVWILKTFWPLYF